jgi:hypothetical protein
MQSAHDVGAADGAGGTEDGAGGADDGAGQECLIGLRTPPAATPTDASEDITAPRLDDRLP